MIRLARVMAGVHTDQRGGARQLLLLAVAATALLGLAGGSGVAVMEILDRVARVLPA